MKVTPVGKNFNQHKIGSEFDIPDKAAKILIRIGKLREVTTVVEATAVAPRTKRTYTRRDMQAQT